VGTVLFPNFIAVLVTEEINLAFFCDDCCERNA